MREYFIGKTPEENLLCSYALSRKRERRQFFRALLFDSIDCYIAQVSFTCGNDGRMRPAVGSGFNR
jgi:hypothetical protein